MQDDNLSKNETHVIVRQYANDYRWDKAGPYNNHIGESEEDASIIRTEVDKTCQSGCGDSTVNRCAAHHEDDRDQWMTSAESEGYNKNTLNDGTNEGG